MRRRVSVLIAAGCATALLSAGLVAAQTAQPAPGEPAPAAVAQPPANELPPQESAPSVAPQSDAKPAAKPAEAGHKDKIEAGDDDADQDKPAGPEPAQRQIHGSAVVQALDKITAETMRFEVKAGQSVRWKGLVFTLRSCETSAPDEAVKDSMAYLLVRSEPRAQSEEASREIFRGWMFAASPGLNPLRHPVYDAWLISCRA